MIGSPVAKRYATALFALAEEKKAVKKIGSDLTDLAAMWESSDSLRAVFLNPSFGAAEKLALLDALCARARVDDTVKNTLRLLAERRRLVHLPEIADAFTRIAERQAGRARVEVVTATKLPETYYATLEKTLRASTGKDVVIVRREDPSIIGGVVTKVGGRVFDGSIKNRLRGLRTQLIAATDPTSQAAP